MKNSIEVYNKLNNLYFLEMINSNKEININNLADLVLEMKEDSYNLNYDEINKFLFKYNNQLNKTKKEYDLDIKSYNVGALEMFLKILLFMERKNKVEDYSKVLQSLNPFQERIIDIIYKNEGIDSKSLREKLKITPQYLYNLTHNYKLNNLINIYGDDREKNKYYSLTVSCREFLNKRKKNKNINVIFNVEMYTSGKNFFYEKVESYVNDVPLMDVRKRVKEENYGISKIIGFNNKF